MTIPTPTSALLDGRATDGGRAMQRAFLWLTASLATAGAIFGLTLLTAAENDREAGRLMIAAQKGTGYVATLATGYALRQGRPYGF